MMQDSKETEYIWEDKAKEALQLLESGELPLFITGKAGTGKSTLLRHFVQNSKGKNIIVLAPTGVAALNAGGQTIHSFFRFPHHPIQSSQIKKVAKSKRALYENIDMIIIDEISMVRADMLDNIDAFLRKNGPEKGRSFGGVRMVFFGDLFQLPPVIAHEIEEQLMKMFYETPYFFSANALRQSGLKTINLEKIHRQKDRDFMDLLNAVRHKSLSYEQLTLLNRRYNPDFRPEEDAFYITLTATNSKAATINKKHLESLPGKGMEFKAERSGSFPANLLPNEEKLLLKKGAQVMFLRNDPAQRWVNGSLGRIVDTDKESVLVELLDSGEEYEVKPVEWEMLSYRFDESKRAVDADVIGTFKQLPLKAAWAITIHKSQGKTFDRVIIDTGRGAFASGQIYVALSRCTTLDGIVLKKRIRMDEIMTDNAILEFASKQGI